MSWELDHRQVQYFMSSLKVKKTSLDDMVFEALFDLTLPHSIKRDITYRLYLVPFLAMKRSLIQTVSEIIVTFIKTFFLPVHFF